MEAVLETLKNPHAHSQSVPRAYKLIAVKLYSPDKTTNVVRYQRPARRLFVIRRSVAAQAIRPRET